MGQRDPEPASCTRDLEQTSSAPVLHSRLVVDSFYRHSIMAADPLTDEDEQYDSANDSDFAPDGEADVVSSADEGDEADEPEGARKRKKPTKDVTAEATDDVVYENSGDEAIITKGKKKLKKSKDADEGGDGGLIKTRAQRAAE